MNFLASGSLFSFHPEQDEMWPLKAAAATAAWALACAAKSAPITNANNFIYPPFYRILLLWGCTGAGGRGAELLILLGATSLKYHTGKSKYEVSYSANIV